MRINAMLIFLRNGIEDVNGSEGVKIHNTSTFTIIEGSLYHMTSIEISKISLLAPRLLLLSAPLLVALAETSWWERVGQPTSKDIKCVLQKDLPNIFFWGGSSQNWAIAKQKNQLLTFHNFPPPFCFDSNRQNTCATNQQTKQITEKFHQNPQVSAALIAPLVSFKTSRMVLCLTVSFPAKSSNTRPGYGCFQRKHHWHTCFFVSFSIGNPWSLESNTIYPWN